MDVTTWGAAVTWAVLVSAIIGLLFIIFFPRFVIRKQHWWQSEANLKIMEERNKLRLTIAQIFFGFAFVATFIQSTLNFNRDLKQKADQSVSEQFAKAVAQIGDLTTAEGQKTIWSTVGAFYVLDYIARDNVQYHEPVYRSMVQYILKLSDYQCGSTKYTDPKYRISPELQAIVRIFADRKYQNDSAYRRFALEHVCLAEAGLLDAEGFYGIWMPGAKLLRGDFRNVTFSKAELSGIKAGFSHNKGWEQRWKGVPSADLHYAFSPEERVRMIANFEGAKFLNAQLNNARFEGANLSNAKFTDAILRGADFRKANLSKADFTGADLTDAQFTDTIISGAIFHNAMVKPSQLVNACIGDSDANHNQQLGKELGSIQPILDEADRQQVVAAGGFKICSRMRK